MSANVESMFYVREPPWHGLGTRVVEAPSSAEVLIMAGLDWSVVQEPIYTGNDLIEGYKANVRDSDRKVLGVVTDRYKVIHNNEAFVDIHNIDIQNVINQLIEEGKAASSIRDALGRVRDCMESAKNNRIISINPCFDIRVPTENKKVKKRFLSVEEQNTFLKQAQQDGDWYFEMFCIMFLTGVRVGELGGLQWDDVDFEQKCIRINRSLSCQYEQGVKKMELTTPKTHNSYRTIPFMGEAEEMFLAQKKKQEQVKKRLGKRWREQEGFENLVFTTSLGSPVTRYVAEKQINKVVEAINYAENLQSVLEGREPRRFEAVHPHAIRHSFASRCFEQNMNPKVVQALMGHQHYSTAIDIYTHITEAKYKEEIEKFGKVVKEE